MDEHVEHPENERSRKEEVVLEICAQEHVTTSNDVDRYYGTLASTFAIYPMKGQGSAGAMRDYIKTVVPSRLLQDEYGNVQPVEDIHSFNLPKLQAKLWCECPQMAAQCIPDRPHRVTERDTMTSTSVASIANTLKENYVFVVRTRSVSSCSFSLCQQIHEEFDQQHQSYEISLEPLLDYATLTVIDDLDLPQWQILLYRRNNDLRFEFAFDFRPYIPKNPVIFCVECLRFLWDRRVESWYIMLKYPHLALSNATPCWEATVPLIARGTNDCEGESSSDDLNEHRLPKSIPLTTFDEQDDDAQVSLQVDGTMNLKRHRNTPFKIWNEPIYDHETKDIEAATEVRSSAIESKSPTPPEFQSTADADADTLQASQLSGWTAVNIPSSMAPSLDDSEDVFSLLYDGGVPTVEQPFVGTFDVLEQLEYPDVHAGFPSGRQEMLEFKPGIHFPASPMSDYGLISRGRLPELPSDPSGGDREGKITPRRTRQFGREVEGNMATPSPSPRRLLLSSPRTPSSPTTYRIQFPRPLNSPRPGSRQGLRSPSNIFPAQSRSLIRSTVPSRLFLQPAPHGINARSNSSKPSRRFQKSKIRGLSINPIPSIPWPEDTVPPTSEFGEGRPDKRVPSAGDVICACRKPAKTFVVRIVECYIPTCRIQWYHWNCLEKGAKISSKHGRWVCENCRAEEEWMKGKPRPKPRGRGRPNTTAMVTSMVAKSVSTDLKAPWSAAELSNAVDSVMGKDIMRDPYELGAFQRRYAACRVEDDDDDASPIDAPVSQLQETSLTTTPSHRRELDACISRQIEAGSQPENNDNSSDKKDEDVDPQTTTLGTLSAFDLVSSKPYWLSRAYSNNRAQFSNEFIDLDILQRGGIGGYEYDYGSSDSNNRTGLGDAFIDCGTNGRGEGEAFEMAYDVPGRGLHADEYCLEMGRVTERKVYRGWLSA